MEIERASGEQVRVLRRRLLQSVDGQPAQQLRKEIGGLLGQNLAVEGYIPHLSHADRVHQKCDIRAASADAFDGLSHIPDVGDIFLIADGFFREREDALEQNLVQLDDIQALLTRRKACES